MLLPANLSAQCARTHHAQKTSGLHFICKPWHSLQVGMAIAACVITGTKLWYSECEGGPLQPLSVLRMRPARPYVSRSFMVKTRSALCAWHSNTL